MRIGILTFQQSNNYGALLQSYALQKTIRDYGHEVDMIRYNCDYISKPYKLVNLKQKGIGAYIFGIIGSICYLPRRRKCNEFRQYFNYSAKVNRNTIVKLSDQYDTFITGSDQVWNHNLTNYDYTYLLDFVKDTQKKFSYAASIGVKSIDDGAKSKYIKLLSSFKKITVREEQGKKLLNTLIDNDINVALDPTLLLKQEDWLKVTNKSNIKENYILVYQLGFSSRMIGFINKLSEREKCKVVYIPFPIGKYVRSKINLTCGPAEWLGLFLDAKYVVTDSFHGTIFSIIFHKKFFTEISDQNLAIGSRIEDLLSKVGLIDRLIVKNEGKEELNGNIDFDIVDKILERERRKSILLLEDILKHD